MIVSIILTPSSGFVIHIKNCQNRFISVKTKDRQKRKTDYHLFEIPNLNFRHTLGFLVRIRKKYDVFVPRVCSWSGRLRSKKHHDLCSICLSSLNKSIRIEKRETALFLSSSYYIFSFRAVRKNPITIFFCYQSQCDSFLLDFLRIRTKNPNSFEFIHLNGRPDSCIFHKSIFWIIFLHFVTANAFVRWFSFVDDCSTIISSIFVCYTIRLI